MIFQKVNKNGVEGRFQVSGGRFERFDGFAVCRCTFEEIADEPRITNPGSNKLITHS